MALVSARPEGEAVEEVAQEVAEVAEASGSEENTGYSFTYAISEEDAEERDLHFGHKESRWRHILFQKVREPFDL